MPVTLIHAGTFWDGLSNAPLGSRDILVKDGIIQQIAEKIPIPADAAVIDLSDRMVMPGLIDCHVHITLRPEMMGSLWSHSAGYKALLGAQALKAHLMNGFTTVRDCGDMDFHGYTVRDVKRAVEQGLIPGSRLINSGHMLSARSGHMDATGMLSPDCKGWQNNLADGPEEIRRVVREEITWGAEWIKFAASGGFASPADNPVDVGYTKEEMESLVATATQYHRPVSAHLHGDEAVRMAVLAGVRSVEHGAMASKKTLQLIEEKGVFLVPTQYAGVRSARFADSEEYWESIGNNPYEKMKMRMYKDVLIANAKNLAESKIKIAFGTDMGILSYSVNGALEFGEMVENGISPLRALRAATSVAAEMLMHPELGTLAPGKAADIIAVRGNPFKDITVMEKVSFVMKAGTVYKQA
ncbi:amidohydrolase family protein [Methanoregula sp.]|uniref:metal-dependent hydrolase family protein n=1 Tax=Methanoregula sp. TaxID=2052170 RepID=UPI00236B1FF0|nr:amidohydrolase family protein [Methanoregula sp.]MDD1686166.1 amidohydrolase family protein [Methanoregula sp.]